jgi:hypothetical protein
MRIAQSPSLSWVFARLAAFVNSRAMQIAKIKPDRLRATTVTIESEEPSWR